TADQVTPERPTPRHLAAEPIIPERPSPRQLPLPAVPTPPGGLIRSATAILRARALIPRIPPVGAAMLARRSRRRVGLPLLMILFTALTTAAIAPLIYEAWLSH
ncbi:MAG TPA: hypothetical protein VIV40_06610, partial [Kofleriaceae bacterium]